MENLRVPDTQDRRKWTSVHDEYKTLNIIGQGTYGTVYKAIDKKTGEYVALKRCRLDIYKDFGIPETTLREIVLLKDLRHKNIMQLYKISCNTERLYMICEYLESDLKHYIRAHMDTKIPLLKIKDITYQILKGVAYCHGHQIIHRDLKPHNILIDKDANSVKLADFGLARFLLGQGKILTHEVVTLWYRSPELLLGDCSYSTEIDIWSLGCIVAEMLQCNPLFVGDCEIDTLFKICRLLGTPDIEDWPKNAIISYDEFPQLQGCENPMSVIYPMLDDIGIDFMQSMLCFNSSKRSTALELLEHPWLEEVAEEKSNTREKPYISCIYHNDKENLAPIIEDKKSVQLNMCKGIYLCILPQKVDQKIYSPEPSDDSVHNPSAQHFFYNDTAVSHNELKSSRFYGQQPSRIRPCDNENYQSYRKEISQNPLYNNHNIIPSYMANHSSSPIDLDRSQRIHETESYRTDHHKILDNTTNHYFIERENLHKNSYHNYHKFHDDMIDNINNISVFKSDSDYLYEPAQPYYDVQSNRPQIDMPKRRIDMPSNEDIINMNPRRQPAKSLINSVSPFQQSCQNPNPNNNYKSYSNRYDSYDNPTLQNKRTEFYASSNSEYPNRNHLMHNTDYLSAKNYNPIIITQKQSPPLYLQYDSLTQSNISKEDWQHKRISNWLSELKNKSLIWFKSTLSSNPLNSNNDKKVLRHYSLEKLTENSHESKADQKNRFILSDQQSILSSNEIDQHIMQSSQTCSTNKENYSSDHANALMKKTLFRKSNPQNRSKAWFAVNNSRSLSYNLKNSQNRGHRSISSVSSARKNHHYMLTNTDKHDSISHVPRYDKTEILHDNEYKLDRQVTNKAIPGLISQCSTHATTATQTSRCSLRSLSSFNMKKSHFTLPRNSEEFAFNGAHLYHRDQQDLGYSNDDILVDEYARYIQADPKLEPEQSQFNQINYSQSFTKLDTFVSTLFPASSMRKNI